MLAVRETFLQDNKSLAMNELLDTFGNDDVCIYMRTDFYQFMERLLIY